MTKSALPSLPGWLPDRFLHGTFAVGESEEGLELNVEDDPETQGDTEAEREIEAIIAGVEPIEESDAVEVLTTWRHTRTAVTLDKLTRGRRPAGTIKP